MHVHWSRESSVVDAEPARPAGVGKCAIEARAKGLRTHRHLSGVYRARSQCEAGDQFTAPGKTRRPALAQALQLAAVLAMRQRSLQSAAELWGRGTGP